MLGSLVSSEVLLTLAYVVVPFIRLIFLHLEITGTCGVLQISNSEIFHKLISLDLGLWLITKMGLDPTTTTTPHPKLFKGF